MDVYEARYRVLEALIQQGPCNSVEVENTIRVGDGTVLDALPILTDLENRCVEYDHERDKWRVSGTGVIGKDYTGNEVDNSVHNLTIGESMGDEYATPVSGDRLAQINEERAR